MAGASLGAVPPRRNSSVVIAKLSPRLTYLIAQAGSFAHFRFPFLYLRSSVVPR